MYISEILSDFSYNSNSSVLHFNLRLNMNNCERLLLWTGVEIAGTCDPHSRSQTNLFPLADFRYKRRVAKLTKSQRSDPPEIIPRVPARQFLSLHPGCMHASTRICTSVGSPAVNELRKIQFQFAAQPPAPRASLSIFSFD